MVCPLSFCMYMSCSIVLLLTSFGHYTSSHRQVSLLLCTLVQEYSPVFIKFCNFINYRTVVSMSQTSNGDYSFIYCLLFLCLFNQTFGFVAMVLLSPTVVMSFHYYLCSKLVSFSTEVTQTICLICESILPLN